MRVWKEGVQGGRDHIPALFSRESRIPHSFLSLSRLIPFFFPRKHGKNAFKSQISTKANESVDCKLASDIFNLRVFLKVMKWKNERARYGNRDLGLFSEAFTLSFVFVAA